MTDRNAPVRLPALALSLGLLAGVHGDGEESAVSESAPIRLADRLLSARIESPLIGLEAAADLAELANPAKDLLLEEDFEYFEWEFAGWQPTSAAEVVAMGEGEGGHVLTLNRPTDASLGWVLPVRSDAFYRFERRVRFEGTPFCDLYVVESRLELEEAGLDVRSNFLAGRGVALKVHSLRIDPDADGWQTDSTSFFPTPRTRSLAVVFRPRVGADPRALVQSMSFDDVRLEEVLPSKKERIRLMKGAHLDRDADPGLGIRKSGLLLPLPSPEGAQEGEASELNYDWRRALYAPPTTELGFDLVVPEDGRLRVGTGLARETPPRAAARFQAAFTVAGGEEELLLDVVRTARMEEWHWEDVDVDLSAWSGREGTLVLRTLAESGDPHPLWANPRVESAGTESDPLVILIAVDTLRADRLSAYGYERETSPAIDRLAADGVLFDQTRSNCNWTCPSFASIFTGLVPSRHGVSSYGPATPLPEDLVTLAEHFQDAGWATRSIAYKVPLFDGNYEQGFDRAFNVPRDFIRGEENLARALEWLEAHRGGPGFLFLHFNDPHQPFVQPEPFDASFGPGPADLELESPVGVPPSSNEEMTQLFSDLYDGSIAYVDDCIGRFLDALRERGLYDRAAIAFVADHGEQFWEHGDFGHGGDDLFDEIVRVPLIVKPSRGTFEAGKIVTADVSGFDVMPTLLELGGIAPAAELDARSLVPLIRGEAQSLGRPVVTETSERGLALVDGGFKLVVEPGGQEEALYDLRGDPAELTNAAADRPEEVERLRALTMAYLLEHRPGTYLVAHAGAQGATLTVASEALRTLVGPAALTSANGASSVELGANVWALLELEGPEAGAAATGGLEPRGPATGFAPWSAGGFASLEGTGLWRFHGPTAVVRTAEEAAGASEDEIDPEQLEALRRLGYVE
jgi:arylsulfatase A-like enzyme